MAKIVLDYMLKIFVLFLAVVKDILIDPAINSFWVNLECPYQSSEHLDAPWVSKHILDIGNIHTKLVCEATFDFKGNFSKDSVHGRDSFI